MGYPFFFNKVIISAQDAYVLQSYFYPFCTIHQHHTPYIIHRVDTKQPPPHTPTQPTQENRKKEKAKCISPPFSSRSSPSRSPSTPFLIPTARIQSAWGLVLEVMPSCSVRSHMYVISLPILSWYKCYNCRFILTRVDPEILSASRVSYVLYLGCVMSRGILWRGRVIQGERVTLNDWITVK